jgi:hypothetical protein
VVKYPFIVTVYRREGTSRPVVQQHNYEDIGLAHADMTGRLANDRTVLKVVLSVVLKEITYFTRNQGRDI